MQKLSASAPKNDHPSDPTAPRPIDRPQDEQGSEGKEGGHGTYIVEPGWRV